MRLASQKSVGVIYVCGAFRRKCLPGEQDTRTAYVSIFIVDYFQKKSKYINTNRRVNYEPQYLFR